MGRHRLGLVAATLTVVVAVAVGGAPAGAGGADRLYPDREFYRPGDPVHLAGDVSKLDRDWFGPYTAYIRPLEAELTESEYVPPGQHPADIAVGRLVVARINPSQVRVEVTFVLPKVADGNYELDYCGPDCSKRIGSLYGSWFFVGSAPYVPPPAELPTAVPTTVAAPVTTLATTRPTTSTTTTTTAPSVAPGARGDLAVEAAAPIAAGSDGGDGRGGGGAATPWPWLIGVVLVLVGGFVVAVRSGGRRRVVVASAPTDVPSHGGGTDGDGTHDRWPGR